MTHRLARPLTQVRDLFAAVQGNARIMVVTEGIAAVSFQWFSTYFSLYMLALGVSEIQVGWLQSVLIVMHVFSTLLGGYVADRLGRKRTLVIFDIICWGVPMFLYAIAQNPWYFLVGRALNGFVYVVMPSFDCLFVEDVPPGNRTAVFGVNQFLMSAARLLAPVAGWLVAWLGIIPAGRAIMLICMTSSVSIAIARQFTLHETRVGREQQANTAGSSPWIVARSYLAAVRSMLQDGKMRTFLLVRILVSFTWVISSTYAALTLTADRGVALSESTISIFPFVSALVAMLMIVLAAGRLHSTAVFGNLLVGQALNGLGVLALILAPRGAILGGILWAAGTAAGTALFRSASQSYWADIVGDRERAIVFSASAAALSLGSLPAGPIAGALYTQSPRAPFLLALALLGLAFLLTLVIRQRVPTRADAAERGL